MSQRKLITLLLFSTCISSTLFADETKWKTLYYEKFDNSSVLEGQKWKKDKYPDDGPFADKGYYFTSRGIKPPKAFRSTHSFGKKHWLTIESYSRSKKAFSELAQIVQDPANSSNSVLEILSPDHTDATVIRPTRALPKNYRVSLRVGFSNFGDGKKGGTNGYNGDEKAEPWRPGLDATSDNGYYWLSIIDSLPRPHNNIWIHHHRKVVIDSDNHTPPWWTNIFDGNEFIKSGEHPVMMFALDGAGEAHVEVGKPFLSFSAGRWHPSGMIRAVDAYLPDEWYKVSITRLGNIFTLSVEGKFKYGGETSYSGSIDAEQNCIWHYNRPDEKPAAGCVDNTAFDFLGAELGKKFPNWSESEGWSDYFVFGDPHSNYYEGSVHYDDVKLEIPL